MATSIAGSTLRPGLKWIGAAVGVGLTVAALTDTCVIGMALAKLPWNRRGNGTDIEALLRALNEAD